MGAALEKPKLFPEKKTFIWFTVGIFFLIVIRVSFNYVSYQEFIEKPFYYTKAMVITSYKKTKNDKRYTVLKLKSEEGFTFYTTTHRKENFNHKRLRLQLFPNQSISFTEYLGTFYVKSKIKHQEKMPLSVKDRLLERVDVQHEQKALKTFYNAIFFATPLEKDLREQIAKLGVSHLVALSGFHLGILWGLIYGGLLLLYRPIQQRFFPYRYALFDVGLIAILFLGMYVWFVDFPPSLVRAYTMVAVGWMVLLLGMELLSFTFLATIILLLVLFLPSLLVSLSFALSVTGVFYIFLLLQYTKTFSPLMISLIFIPLGIFVLMLPVVHFFFGVTSVYQLSSPLLSILFVPFYPLVMLLHLLGMGGLFDGALVWLFALPSEAKEAFLPLWMMLAYLGLSFGAIWSRKVFYSVVALAVSYMVYLFIFVE